MNCTYLLAVPFDVQIDEVTDLSSHKLLYASLYPTLVFQILSSQQSRHYAQYALCAAHCYMIYWCTMLSYIMECQMRKIQILHTCIHWNRLLSRMFPKTFLKAVDSSVYIILGHTCIRCVIVHCIDVLLIIIFMKLDDRECTQLMKILYTKTG